VPVGRHQPYCGGADVPIFSQRRCHV
jgi:hypothetical protein